MTRRRRPLALRVLTTVLVLAALMQVTLGTLFRHLQPDPETPRGLRSFVRFDGRTIHVQVCRPTIRSTAPLISAMFCLLISS